MEAAAEAASPDETWEPFISLYHIGIKDQKNLLICFIEDDFITCL